MPDRPRAEITTVSRSAGIDIRRDRVGDADALLAIPAGPPGSAVLVLSGSSGRIDEAKVRLLAEAGAVALGLRWFGGAGQPPGICEVPLETFTPALDRLASHDRPLAVVGTSKGAEAALLVAAADARVRTVVAFAPTDVVWANIGAGRDGLDAPPRSSWTRQGQSLPFVPYAPDWQPDRDPPAYLDWYLRSRERYPDDVRRAAIPVEQFDGSLLLVAGGDDQVWDSHASALRIRARRAAVGLATTVVTHRHAGHRTVLPGEAPTAAGHRLRRGGTPSADTENGLAAWGHLVALLGLAGP